MAKPIFIIRIPVSALETMGVYTLTQITKDLQTQLHDYHVLSMADNRIDSAKFECFNVEHMDAITVAEMREQIINAIDQLK
jgi:hypothetical protein